jgi:hypothetical protein
MDHQRQELACFGLEFQRLDLRAHGTHFRCETNMLTRWYDPP